VRGTSGNSILTSASCPLELRQLDLDVGERIGARRTLPFAKGIANDCDDTLLLDDAPRGLSVRSEFQPAHLWFLFV
jgi:hypothetical protein